MYALIVHYIIFARDISVSLKQRQARKINILYIVFVM